jgi:hypothetical protein
LAYPEATTKTTNGSKEGVTATAKTSNGGKDEQEQHQDEIREIFALEANAAWAT